MAKYKSPATRNYLIRLFVLMSIYMITLFAAVTMFRAGGISGVPAYALAVAPALPIIGVFWAVMRFLVEEPDEFIRMLLVRQSLVATGFCLTVMTVWEFLQNFELVPQGNGGFGAAFFWFMGLFVGAIYNKLTIGTAGYNSPRKTASKSCAPSGTGASRIWLMRFPFRGNRSTPSKPVNTTRHCRSHSRHRTFFAAHR